MLRILEDAGSAGTQLSNRGAVAGGDPDVTRLLDRLEERELAQRTREAADRRIVTARITAAGRRLLASLEDPVSALHERQLGPLGKQGIRDLRRLLQKAAAIGPVI